MPAGGRKVVVIEAGAGPSLVYLHGFADVHGVAGDLLPFHQGLAHGRKLIAPAHPAYEGYRAALDVATDRDFARFPNGMPDG